MIQRSAFPSTLTELPSRLDGGSARQAQARPEPVPAAGPPRLLPLRREFHNVRSFLRLPRDVRSFAYFVAALGILCGGMALHIFLSAQILAARVELRAIRADYELRTRQNAELVWQIAEAKSLPAVLARAQALGYGPSAEPQYIVQVTPHESMVSPTAQRPGGQPDQAMGDVTPAAPPSTTGALTSGQAAPGQGTDRSNASWWRPWGQSSTASGAEPRSNRSGGWLEMLQFYANR